MEGAADEIASHGRWQRRPGALCIWKEAAVSKWVERGAVCWPPPLERVPPDISARRALARVEVTGRSASCHPDGVWSEKVPGSESARLAQGGRGPGGLPALL